MTVREGEKYAPSVGNPFVPGTTINSRAGEIVGGALRSFGGTVSALGASLEKQQKDKLNAEYTSSLSDFSNFQLESEQGLQAMVDESGPNEANFYDRAEAYISNQQMKFKERLKQPELQQKFDLQITTWGNSLRERALKVDREKKTSYFVNGAKALWNQQGIILQNNPAQLDEARAVFADYVMNSSLTETQKAEVLRDGETSMQAIVYGKEAEREATRSDSWIKQNSSRLAPRIMGIESGFVGVSRETAEKVEIIDQTGGKTRNLPVSTEVDYKARSAIALLGEEYGAVYISGGQAAKGTPGAKRTGSTRHDIGGAVDLVLTRNGREVTPRQDPTLYAEFFENAAAMGFEGLGHYDWGVHVGGGDKAAWGPDKTGETLSPQFAAAIERGRKRAAFSSRSNSNSTADGPSQMIDSTWDEFMQTRHPDVVAQVGMEKARALKDDIGYAQQATEWYLDRVGRQLRRNGLPVNDATMYLGYFLGEGGVVKALQADDTASVREVMGPKVVEANKFLKGMTVADLKEWAATKTGQATVSNALDNDPRFSLLDLTTRNQLRKDAQEKAQRSLAAAEKAENERKAEVLNQALVGIYTGDYTRKNFEEDFRAGNYDKYDSIMKIERAFKEREEGQADQAVLAGLQSGALAFDPKDDKHRKAVNKAGEAVAEPFINARDPQAAKAVQNVIDLTYGTGAPSGAVSKLAAMTRHNDPANAIYALGQLKTLLDNNPHMLEDYVPDDVRKRLSVYDPNATAEENAKMLGIGETAPQQQARVQLITAANERIGALKKDGTLTADKVVDNLYNGWLSSAPSVDAPQKLALASDYEKEWREGYVLNNGNEEAATKYAETMLQRRWGTTTIGGQKRLMRYPPSMVANLTSIPEEYLENQLNYEVRQLPGVGKDDRVILTSDDQTEREVQALRKYLQNGGTAWDADAPKISYTVTAIREDGVVSFQSNPFARGSRFTFDTDEIKEWKDENFRREVLRKQYVQKKRLYPGDAMSSLYGGPMVPDELKELDVPEYGKQKKAREEALKRTYERLQTIPLPRIGEPTDEYEARRRMLEKLQGEN